MEMHYLAKFDDLGRYEKIILLGIHYHTDEEKQKYIDEGYIPISDEDYQFYIGNRGTGDNGMGYIYDAVTGRPISAPLSPQEHNMENEDVSISSEIMDMAEMMLDMSENVQLVQAGGRNS